MSLKKHCLFLSLILSLRASDDCGSHSVDSSSYFEQSVSKKDSFKENLLIRKHRESFKSLDIHMLCRGAMKIL